MHPNTSMRMYMTIKSQWTCGYDYMMFLTGPTYAADVLTQNRNSTLSLNNGAQLFQAFTAVDFDGVTGAIRVDASGERLMNVSISNFFLSEKWIRIGQFDGADLSLSAAPVWGSSSTVKPWGQAQVRIAALVPQTDASNQTVLGKYITQALALAVDSVNQNDNILENYSLVSSVSDTKSAPGTGIVAVSSLRPCR